jgi:hypothetical protein
MDGWLQPPSLLCGGTSGSAGLMHHQPDASMIGQQWRWRHPSQYNYKIYRQQRDQGVCITYSLLAGSCLGKHREELFHPACQWHSGMTQYALQRWLRQLCKQVAAIRSAVTFVVIIRGCSCAMPRAHSCATSHRQQQCAHSAPELAWHAGMLRLRPATQQP